MQGRPQAKVSVNISVRIILLWCSSLTIKTTDERHPKPSQSRTDVRAAHSVHRMVGADGCIGFREGLWGVGCSDLRRQVNGLPSPTCCNVQHNVIPKDGLPLVPTVHHVVHGPRILNPQLPWHGLFLSNCPGSVNSECSTSNTDSGGMT